MIYTDEEFHVADAFRLAVRTARARVPSGPLHLVGYSNGGALALKHALDKLNTINTSLEVIKDRGRG